MASLGGVVLLLLATSAVGGMLLSLSRGKALDEAREAGREGKRKLVEAYLAEADAKRMSRRPGQRYVTLEKIRDAMELAKEVGMSDEARARARNIAIAALCLPDLQPGREWNAESGRAITAGLKGHRTGGIHLRFNPSGDRLVSSDWHRRFRLWDAATGRHLLLMPGWGIYDFDFDEGSHGSGGARGREQRVCGGQEMRVLRRPTSSGSEEIRGLGLHPGGRLLALRTWTGIALFDLRAREEITFLGGNFNEGRFDETGFLWTASDAGLVRWPVRLAPEVAAHFRIGPPEWVADLLNEARIRSPSAPMVASWPCLSTLTGRY